MWELRRAAVGHLGEKCSPILLIENSSCAIVLFVFVAFFFLFHDDPNVFRGCRKASSATGQL